VESEQPVEESEAAPSSETPEASEPAAATAETPTEAEAESAPEAAPLSKEPALGTMADVEQHFRANFAATEIVKIRDRVLAPGSAVLNDSAPAVLQLTRALWEHLDRFPLPLAHSLGQQLSARGLQIFKAHDNITYVGIARPRYLDRVATPVSEALAGMLDYLESHASTPRLEQWQALVELRGPIPEGAEKERESIVAKDLSWLLHEGHVVDYIKRGLEVTVKAKPAKPPTPPKSTPARAAAAPKSSPTPAAGAPQASSQPAAATAQSTPEPADIASENPEQTGVSPESTEPSVAASENLQEPANMPESTSKPADVAPQDTTERETSVPAEDAAGPEHSSEPATIVPEPATELSQDVPEQAAITPAPETTETTATAPEDLPETAETPDSIQETAEVAPRDAVKPEPNVPGEDETPAKP
jgi:hypothetical protein